jgi:hypothetical protein
MTNVWNNLDTSDKQTQSKTALRTSLTKNNTKPNPYYYLGKRPTNMTLARLRMQCSELSQHLFNMHILPSGKCVCGQPETTKHYFTECPLFHQLRQLLITRTTDLNLSFNVNKLLHGSSDTLANNQLIYAIDDYLRTSGRFTLFSTCH